MDMWCMHTHFETQMSKFYPKTVNILSVTSGVPEKGFLPTVTVFGPSLYFALL